MFFIAGTRGETTTIETGQFYCPECKSNQDYHYDQVHEKVTVFFISVANLKLLGEYVECQQCLNTYKTEVLDYDPEDDEREFEALYVEGIKTVMIAMTLADGKIDDEEKEMIKKIFEEITGFKLSDDDIEVDLYSYESNYISLEKYVKNLFPYLNDSGKENILKVAYYVSIADGELNHSEEKLLNNLAKKLQLSKTHLKGIIAEINE